MPFKSQAQRRYMYANLPKIAKRWSKHTPKGKNLPEYVDESLDETTAGSSLEFKNVRFPSRTTAVVTYQYVSKKDNIDLALTYSVGKTSEEIDYVHAVIRDNNDPHGKPTKFDDPQSESFARFVDAKKINLTPDDIEMAGQDGYDKIQSSFTDTPKLDDPYEESLEFETLVDKILNEEKSKV